MTIPKEAYHALQSIVGPEWVSDDPAICEADRYCILLGEAVQQLRPACSIEPASGEEVQAIVKVANQYKLPFFATSSHCLPDAALKKNNTILIDLKRMNQFEINEENLYAVVEPGVTFAVLQAELFSRGLFTFVPGCGGETSVLANTINMGDAPLGWRHGLGYQRILGAEWVLPDGEMLKLGSRSLFRNFFWGEGPGPDLRGLLKGQRGQRSKLGIVTKVGVKIFPFVPEKLEPEGWSFHTTLKLPPNRFKWYNIRFQNKDNAIKAMIEMGKCELGLIVMSVPPLFFTVARSRGQGCEGFWKLWNETGPKLNPNQLSLRVLLYGIGSDKRLAYEEQVLLDICKELDGSARESPGRDETNFMASDAICANTVGGRFNSEVCYESIGQGLKYSQVVNEITAKHKPPILEDYGTTNWISPYELGYISKLECLRMTAVEDGDELEIFKQECHKACIEHGVYPLFVNEPEVFSPAWQNYQEKERKVKEIFDPNNISYPDE